MEVNIHGDVFMIFFMFSLWIDTDVFGAMCPNWKLSGGFFKFEGMVTVLYNGTWVNICADSFNDNAQKRVCTDIFPDHNKINMYDSNVFSVDEQERSISYTSCVDSVNTTRHKCTVASLCCSNDDLEVQCSRNWTGSLKLKDRYKAYHSPIRQYRRLIGGNFEDSTISKSWTLSALKEEPCNSTISPLQDNINKTVRNCSNTCPLTSELSFILFNDNKTCCLERQSMEQFVTDDCSVRNLTDVDMTTENSGFCIAAEVINGDLYISAEECGLLLQPFNISDDFDLNECYPDPCKNGGTCTDGVKTYTCKCATGYTGTNCETTYIRTTRESKYRGHTNRPEPTTTQEDTTESFNTVVIAVVVCVVVLVLVLIVIVVAVLWKMMQSNRKNEQLRPNSVANRTYRIEGFQELHQDAEEYTLISDMEIEHSSAEPYRPPVPDRGDSSNSSNLKDKCGTEIIILGDYSSPSDQLRVGYKISQTSDYCMTTYDDPVRLKEKEVTENTGKSDNVESRSRDSKEEKSNKRDSKTNSKILDRNSRNSQMSSPIQDLVISDLKTDTQNDNTNQRDTDDINESDIVTHTPQQATVEHCIVPLAKPKQITEADEHFESFNLCDTKLPEDSLAVTSKESDTGVSKDLNEDSDYEDSNIIDGNFPSTCSSKRVLDEHVCLDCLKPEHLKRLGIKIISEEIYEKHKDLHRSVSEPQNCYYNIERAGEEKVDPKLPGSQSNHITCEQEHDTVTELKVMRRKKKSGTTRRCSVCHTVYDRLGVTEQNAWANCTDNVYDSFGDFKHFKHRQQLCGKRTNST